MPTKKKGGLPPHTKTNQSMGNGLLDSAHSRTKGGSYKGVNKPFNSINVKPSASSGTLGNAQPVMKSSGYTSVKEQRMTTLGTPHISVKPKK